MIQLHFKALANILCTGRLVDIFTRIIDFLMVNGFQNLELCLQGIFLEVRVIEYVFRSAEEGILLQLGSNKFQNFILATSDHRRCIRDDVENVLCTVRILNVICD